MRGHMPSVPGCGSVALMAALVVTVPVVGYTAILLARASVDGLVGVLASASVAALLTLSRRIPLIAVARVGAGAAAISWLAVIPPLIWDSRWAIGETSTAAEETVGWIGGVAAGLAVAAGVALLARATTPLQRTGGVTVALAGCLGGWAGFIAFVS